MEYGATDGLDTRKVTLKDEDQYYPDDKTKEDLNKRVALYEIIILHMMPILFTGLFVYIFKTPLLLPGVSWF